MLIKLRRRFVGAAMAAFTAVILVLLCAVNLWNYTVTTTRQDDTLKQLMEFESRGEPPFGERWRQPRPFGEPPSPEMPYMTRFFTVRYDAVGVFAGVDQEFIASVSAEDAAAYGSAVLGQGRASGWHRGYRYLVERNDDGTAVVFLNGERELQAMRSLLLISGGAALLSLGAVFVLVVLFSKRAIAPYVRNIETQKRFITDAGHELKTPLTAIATSADVLAMEHGDDEWVKNIQSQAARMSRLVTDLVTLSRLDEEQPFPEKADFSLSEAVWEIAEPFANIAQAKGENFEHHIEDGVTVHGDQAAIQQMTSILLDNALKYSDEGGRIRLSVRRRQKKAELQVYNTCAGVDRDDLDRLFDRFYRPDTSRAQCTGGTGIGLSIARATAERHGGTISAQSEDGESITFTVRL